MKHRNRVETQIFVGMTVGLFLTFLNPYFCVFVAQKITGVDVYWRLYWILPIYIVIAYAITDVIPEQPQWNVCLAAVGAMLILSLSGTNMYQENLYFSKHCNEYKITDESLTVVQKLEEDDDDATCIFPEDMSFYIRQYTSKISVIKGRGMATNGSTIGDTVYTLSQLYDLIYNRQELDNPETLNLLKYLGVDYVYSREKWENSIVVEEIVGYGYLYLIP
jgi:hypothetical protein